MSVSLTKKKNEKTEEVVHDILMKRSADRRLLPHVPNERRQLSSRRSVSDDLIKKYPYLNFYNGEDANVRYDVRYSVSILTGNPKKNICGLCIGYFHNRYEATYYRRRGAGNHIS